MRAVLAGGPRLVARASARALLKPGGRPGFTEFGKGDPRWDRHRDLLRSPRSGEPRQAKEPAPHRDRHDEIETGLSSLGFDSITFVEESYDLVFADADEWWRWVWSQGQRGFLEVLDDGQLERYRADVYARLAEPIVNTWTVLFVFARRA